MALHKAEQIIAAVITLLTGLTTTTTNVERGRFFPVEDDIAAALTIRQGALTPTSEPNVSFQDAVLVVVITAHAKGADDAVEATINLIAKEVYVALMANRTLGLAFVHDTAWQGNGEPSLDVAEKSVMSMELRFACQFRHGYTDPSA